MAHIVKCDGEVFFVPAGYLRAVLSNLSAYMECGEINYRDLMSDIKSQKLTDLLPPLAEMGFVDFDRMKEEKSERPFVTDSYRPLLGRLANFVQ